MIFRKCILGATAILTAFASTAVHAQRLSTLRDAEIEKYLEDYSHPIFRAAGLPEDSIEIIIVNDPSFNAFAGGRYMGINTGLLTIADTPNQVEAVIAHEAGHLAGGHSARRGDAMKSATVPMLLGLLLAAGAAAAGAPDAGIGALSLGQTIGQANYLKYSRGQEAAADQASITYLDKVGHSSKGALELWRKMRNSQIIRRYKINPYMQTHPMANDRLTALRTRAESSPHYEHTNTPEEMERHHYIQAKIHGFLSDTNEALRRYPLTDQSGPAHYARAVAYFRNSQIDRALEQIRHLTALDPENAYFHELEGQMLFEFGRVHDAISPHQRAVALLPDNALLRINLGRALLATEDYTNIDASIAELKRALLLENNNSFGWFELARAYSASGNDTMANLATAESRYHAGAKGDAMAFARRAMANLERNSPEWRHAAEIVRASQPTDPGKGAIKVPLPDKDSGKDGKKENPAPKESDPEKQPDVPDPTLAPAAGR